MVDDTSPRRSNHTNQNNNAMTIESNLIELLPGQLYFGCFPNSKPVIDKNSELAKKTVMISIHNKYHYEPFYEDFGPWNLSVLYRLCVQIDKLLEIEEKRGRRIVWYCQEDETGTYEKVRVNTAYVLGAYLIIYQGFSADDAYLKVSSGEGPKMIGFRDASMGAPQYLLHLHDVLRGIEKALRLGWLDFSDFDYEEYEFYERVENGDLNWIIPGKILSFCGPHNESREENGYPYHAPEVYFDYFRTKNVSTIVRLNAKNYDAGKFTRAGFQHVDMFFVDGSTPSDEIMVKFLKVVDTAKGGVAIHCKAGLGRTGTLIACWMMKEFGLTAGECMGWMRVCRPGSVIGPQQKYLVEKQKMCWSLSASNGVHLSPRREEKEKKSAVRKLATQVDDICIGDDRKPQRSRENTRPNILRRKVQVQNQNGRSPIVIAPEPTSSGSPMTSRASRASGASGAREVDETALDAHGRSQGDRLLALKAKHQHEHPVSPSEPLEAGASHRRFIKYSAPPPMAFPSQAYLNRNREALKTTPTKVSSSGATSSGVNGSSGRQLRSTANGNVAYRTRNSTANGVGTLSRTGNESYRFHNSLFYEPASAVFPSMASRRSEATRYHSPTTPIKPMSPAFPSDSGNVRYKTRLRAENHPIGKTTATPFNGSMQPQISKCTLTATAETKSPRRILTMPLSSKSTSSLKKIQVSRPRPYPSTGVRVELCANGKSYDIRPRRETPVIPGAGLPANTEAFIGRRK